MTRLTDLHTILLSTASQRVDGSLYPMPDGMADTSARLVKALKSLTERGLVEQRDLSDQATANRDDGDVCFGLFITDAGRSAIGVDTASDSAEENASPAPAPKPVKVSKADSVLALLRRDQGATLAELIAATGWLPHATRAALTGLRKKGHAVERSKRDDTTCYRVAA